MYKKSTIKTDAIFKCIVTFKNGAHKILRISIDMVAKITYEFRECQKNLFKETWLLFITANDFINLSQIKSCKFINERTGSEFLSIE